MAPVLTARMAEDYRSYRSGSAGPTWTNFVDQRCVSTVTEPTASVSREAPQGKRESYVDTEGAIITKRLTGIPPAATEHVSATLELEQGSDGLWRVERRVY